MRPLPRYRILNPGVAFTLGLLNLGSREASGKLQRSKSYRVHIVTSRHVVNVVTPRSFRTWICVRRTACAQQSPGNGSERDSCTIPVVRSPIEYNTALHSAVYILFPFRTSIPNCFPLSSRVLTEKTQLTKSRLLQDDDVNVISKPGRVGSLAYSSLECSTQGIIHFTSLPFVAPFSSLFPSVTCDEKRRGKTKGGNHVK